MLIFLHDDMHRFPPAPNEAAIFENGVEGTAVLACKRHFAVRGSGVFWDNPVGIYQLRVSLGGSNHSGGLLVLIQEITARAAKLIMGGDDVKVRSTGVQGDQPIRRLP
ncbi:hypothetical protein BA171_02400 [Candidatus Hamiltonella defensa (Bemisia tabaci)]|uniref:Uncharacterized protein n=1 Tax=Candidatus Hamiltonella defensa (Bemisia tabaci) TaxID=672795 RepID=A0A249DYZ1_9ENTR|nr:hypothetical protein BA171_02400 [Candidatus Hamiltonella defensa (Bemisia tabaci)]